jgi:hypothetical protein
MSNTYNVAGFSSKNGKVSVRVANGSAAARTKVLERDGHTEVDLIDLPSAMSKEDAIAFVSKAMNRAVEAKAPKATATKAPAAPKAPKTVKVTKTVAEVKEMVAEKPALTEDEQAVKDLNLRTMQAVSARLAKIRDVA